MRLIKYDNVQNDPWYDLDRLFERTFGEFGRGPGFAGARARAAFRVDVYQDENNHYILAELPGFDRKDANVELENEVLTITATRKPAGKEGEAEEIFSRSITVDKSVLADKVTAKLENGLLRITLPKAEERRPKLIKVS